MNAEILNDEGEVERRILVEDGQAGIDFLNENFPDLWREWVNPDALREAKMAVRDAINADRDRRVRRPFPFAGHRFDYDDDSQKRITGAGALAHIAITVGGKAPDDPRWHGGEDPFVWIAADNSLVPMDAGTVLAFGQAAGAWDSAHVFAARALKDAIDAAETDAELDALDLDAGWPE